MNKTTLIITCEHCGNYVPKEYQYLFSDYQQLLSTHHGYDVGVKSLARQFAEAFNVKLFNTKITRLIVDCNRSLWRSTLFSEITKPLSKKEKNNILQKYYYPHRNKISDYFKSESSAGQRLLHLALHSFTPVLNSQIREAELGFLYDPSRKNEKEISRIWKKQMSLVLPGWRLRFNYPYRGKPDGLTAHFRKIYPDNRYLGIELELNQKFVNNQGSIPDDICNKIVESFRSTIREFKWL